MGGASAGLSGGGTIEGSSATITVTGSGSLALAHSSNFAGNWIVNSPATLRFGADAHLGVATNPANPRLVYALSDRGLYHSRDAGATWIPVTDKRLPAVGRIRKPQFRIA